MHIMSYTKSCIYQFHHLVGLSVLYLLCGLPLYLKLFSRSPYSDMALLPILAFFFCSAGPFLFFLYAVRQLIEKVRGKLTKEVEEVEEVEEKVNSFVSSPHVTKSHRVSMSGQMLEKETERLKSFSTESNSTL